MKQLFYCISVVMLSLTFVTCSSSNDENTEIKSDFSNPDYIKYQMVGKWNYWGHLSPSTNSWWYSGDVYKWYFVFKEDGTYECKNLSSDLQKGTYWITPATAEYNAILYLNYNDGTKDRTRKIILKKLESKSAIIYESSFDERYDKE